MRIRLSQPPAGDLLAGDWAELGNMKVKAGPLIQGSVPELPKKCSQTFRIYIID